MGLPLEKEDPIPNADQLISRLKTDLMLISLQFDNIMVMLNDRDLRNAQLAGASKMDEQAITFGTTKES